MNDLNKFLSSLSDEQKDALLKALSSKPKDNKEDQEPRTKHDFTVDNKKQPNSRRKEPVKARKNEWVDTGEFRDIETEYGERTPRNRKPHKKVDVECSVCGRSFKTDPKYVYGEYHRCNRCVKR